MSKRDEEKPGDGNEPRDLARENEINALLEGALDKDSMDALKAAAAGDSRLAQDIVNAWRLQQCMDQLSLEKAPASLRQKLRRIPREQTASFGWPSVSSPRWLLAGGLASAALLTVTLVLTVPDRQQAPGFSPRTDRHAQEDAARVAQAQRELATAFYYLDKVGLRVGREIHEVINDELAEPVRENLSKHMPYAGRSHKEKHA